MRINKRNATILVVLGAALCAVGVGVALRPWETGQSTGTSTDSRSPEATGSNQTLKWRKVEVSVGDKKGIFEVAKFDPPVPFNAIPLDQTRRDTPLNTWVSFKSHGVAGKNEDDLKRFAAHYLDPHCLLDLVRDKVKLPPDQYFERLRQVGKNATAVGLVKYRGYTLLLSKFQGSGKFSDRTYLISACMVKKNGKYYIDERPKEEDPILMELVDTHFKRLGF